MKKIAKRSNCPISYTLDLFGDKWTFLIIRDLVFKKRKFYNEFLEGGEGIATNILSDRLKKLEEAGILKSKTYTPLKTKKVYSLTSKGLDLIPVLIEMIIWGASNDKQTDASPEFVERALKNRSKLIKEIISSLDH